MLVLVSIARRNNGNRRLRGVEPGRIRAVAAAVVVNFVDIDTPDLRCYGCLDIRWQPLACTSLPRSPRRYARKIHTCPQAAYVLEAVPYAAPVPEESPD